jgi:hypothetical protein
MPDDTHRMMQPGDSGDDRALGLALRALPTMLPPVSPLPRLQAQWARQHKRRTPLRHAPWWALAAGVAAIGLGVMMFRDTAPVVDTATVAANPSRVEQLMAQSAEWETALHRFEQQSIPMDAGSALASAELEDMIGLTDLQLSATETEAQAESLWQRRVSLMSRLAEVRTQSAWQRGSTEQNPMLLAAAYPVN